MTSPIIPTIHTSFLKPYTLLPSLSQAIADYMPIGMGLLLRNNESGYFLGDVKWGANNAHNGFGVLTRCDDDYDNDDDDDDDDDGDCVEMILKVVVLLIQILMVLMMIQYDDDTNDDYDDCVES